MTVTKHTPIVLTNAGSEGGGVFGKQADESAAPVSVDAQHLTIGLFAEKRQTPATAKNAVFACRSGFCAWQAAARVSGLLCMSKLVHASPMKEHDDNDDIQRTTRRTA